MTILPAIQPGRTRDAETRSTHGRPATTTFEIHSEARGPHWVAWLTEPGQKGPYHSILLVGASREEAEARARDWSATLSGQTNTSSRSS